MLRGSLLCMYTGLVDTYTVHCIKMVVAHVCSVQSENLHNLEIVLHIFRIPRLRTIVARSQDCAIQVRYLENAQL